MYDVSVSAFGISGRIFFPSYGPNRVPDLNILLEKTPRPAFGIQDSLTSKPSGRLAKLLFSVDSHFESASGNSGPWTGQSPK